MLIAALLLMAAPAPKSVVSSMTHKPERMGQCFTSRVKTVETRLVDGPANTPVPGSGSAMTLEDGHYTVSYDQIPAIDTSRVGDPVKLCVTALPKRCPKGDTRGIAYRWTNLRSHKIWSGFDAEHLCGGA